MPERPVTEEALKGMIKALEEFVTDTATCIQALQNDANTCADNMNGDEASAKAIIRINKCIGHYRQINERANTLRAKMIKKLRTLEEMQEIIGGDDDY